MSEHERAPDSRRANKRRRISRIQHRNDFIAAIVQRIPELPVPISQWWLDNPGELGEFMRKLGSLPVTLSETIDVRVGDFILRNQNPWYKKEQWSEQVRQSSTFDNLIGYLLEVIHASSHGWFTCRVVKPLGSTPVVLPLNSDHEVYFASLTREFFELKTVEDALSM